MDKRRLLYSSISHVKRSVLDRYFHDITVQLIASEKEGQDRIANIARLWTRVEADQLKRNHN